MSCDVTRIQAELLQGNTLLGCGLKLEKWWNKIHGSTWKGLGTYHPWTRIKSDIVVFSNFTSNYIKFRNTLVYQLCLKSLSFSCFYIFFFLIFFNTLLTEYIRYLAVADTKLKLNGFNLKVSFGWEQRLVNTKPSKIMVQNLIYI